MTACDRLLARLNSIEHKYGDVALAASMFCLAIAVHGAFAVASLHKRGGLTDAGDASGIVAQLEQPGTRVLFDDIDRPAPATTQSHEIPLAQVTEQPATAMMNSTRETVPAKSSRIPRQDTAAQSASAAPVRSIVAKTVTADQLDGSADKPAISALGTNEGSGPSPLTVSALFGEDSNVLSESAPSAQPTISALPK